MTSQNQYCGRTFLVFFSCVFFFLYVEDCFATPESRAAANFLLFSPSTRSNGMGEVGVALTDEVGAYYNPATPALIAKTHWGGAVNYLGRMQVVPGLASDIDVGYRAFMLGWNSNHWARTFSGDTSPNPFSYSLAFTYYRVRANLGTQFQTDAQGNGSLSQSVSSANHYAVSLGAHYGIDLGVGIALKEVSEQLSNAGAATGWARDFGIQARVPMVDLLERSGKRDLSFSNQWRPRFDLSFGAAWNNRGDDLTFSATNQSDPLPAYRSVGLATTLGLSRSGWNLFEVTASFERYTPQVNGIEEPGTADKMRGFEVALLDIVDIRWGTYDDEDGQRHFDTWGYTLKSDGIFRFIKRQNGQDARNSTWVDFFADHVSLSWTYFKKTGSPIFDGVSQAEFKVLFR